MGIEPTALAWEARVLPLYDARADPHSTRDLTVLPVGVLGEVATKVDALRVVLLASLTFTLFVPFTCYRCLPLVEMEGQASTMSRSVFPQRIGMEIGHMAETSDVRPI
jgi:hypothetical protein